MGKRMWRRDVAKERFWRRTIAEQRRSGMTIREFCSRRSVSEPLFYAWRRELAQRDGSVARKAPPAGELPAAPRFVALKVAAEPPAAMIEIVTRGGHTLRVPPGVDRQTLADVWALVEGQPC
jgi:transposase-like protein